MKLEIMRENEKKTTTMDVDIDFLKSKRGILKVAEMVGLFVAFVCFTAASTPRYIAASVLEFLITSLLVLLYLLKLNKRLTFIFWPLVDVFNSVFAAVYLAVLSLMAMTSYVAKGTLAGGIVFFLSAGLLCVDTYTLFKLITLNRSRNDMQSQAQEESN